MTHPAFTQRLAAAQIEMQPFTCAHTPGVIDLLSAEGWDTYTVDPERTARALSAPGCTTLLALDGAMVVALVQLQSDGEIQAHLSALLVAAQWRRHGLGRLLLYEALKRAGGIHVDVLTKNRAFYESLGGRPRSGFRLTLEQLYVNTKPNAASATQPTVWVQP